MKPFNYVEFNAPPDTYHCRNCGARGVKLWREYQTTAPKLLCCDCAAADQGKDISEITPAGKIPNGRYGTTDQIGWFVPAVPMEGIGDGYWGYTSVPDIGVAWWWQLPLRDAARPPRDEGVSDG